MLRIQRCLVHLRNGTLPERLRLEWRQYIKRRRLAWWESQVSKSQYVETTIQPDVRMRLYFDSQLSQRIYCRDFELKERWFLNAFLKRGDAFVDIGANIGLFTLIAAHRVGNAGYVYAFEPCSRTYQRLLANVTLNGLANVSCYQLALSDDATQLNMNVSLDGFDAWNSLAQPIAGHSFAVETVNCTTWDSFAREHNLFGRVTMMKIDVEGWETRVLLGASETLSRMDAPVLQVEFTEEASRAAGSSCAELYHLLEDRGYQMFVYDVKSRKLVRDPLRESYPYLNLIAAKRPEQVAARLENRSRLPWLR
jgi:FkbM family methyltransferase